MLTGTCAKQPESTVNETSQFAGKAYKDSDYTIVITNPALTHMYNNFAETHLGGGV